MTILNSKGGLAVLKMRKPKPKPNNYVRGVDYLGEDENGRYRYKIVLKGSDD